MSTLESFMFDDLLPVIEARTDLVLVDEIHNLNHGTPAGEDLSSLA